MRRAAAVTAATLAALLLTGCGPYAPRDLPLVDDASAVAGTWTRTDGDVDVVLELRDDGTMTFTGVPRDLGAVDLEPGCDETLAASTDRVSGDGTWRLWVPGQYDIDFAGQGSLAVPGGFLDFSRLHFLCTDPDSGDVYSFERQD